MRRDERASLLLDIHTGLERADDGCVGGWASDAAFLEFFDESGFGIARRRLRLFLFRMRFDERERFLCCDLRQFDVFAARSRIGLEPAVEDDARTVGREGGNGVF